MSSHVEDVVHAAGVAVDARVERKRVLTCMVGVACGCRAVVGSEMSPNDCRSDRRGSIGTQCIDRRDHVRATRERVIKDQHGSALDLRSVDDEAVLGGHMRGELFSRLQRLSDATIGPFEGFQQGDQGMFAVASLRAWDGADDIKGGIYLHVGTGVDEAPLVPGHVVIEQPAQPVGLLLTHAGVGAVLVVPGCKRQWGAGQAKRNR